MTNYTVSGYLMPTLEDVTKEITSYAKKFLAEHKHFETFTIQWEQDDLLVFPSSNFSINGGAVPESQIRLLELFVDGLPIGALSYVLNVEDENDNYGKLTLDGHSLTVTRKNETVTVELD